MPLSTALRRLFLSLASLAGAAALFGADLRVDQLELLSHGYYSSTQGSFAASSLLFYDLSFEGGDKFAAQLKMNFQNDNLENAMTEASQATTSTAEASAYSLLSPVLETASVTAKSVFNTGLDFSFFVGQMDKFCTGDDFVALFGAAPFGTDLRGPIVYPNGVGGNGKIWFDGISEADGTGFRLATTPKLFQNMEGYLYLYQDTNSGTGTWSGDLRWLLNSQNVKGEVFAGATTSSGYGTYRGGLLFFATSGQTGEFFAQVGITHWVGGDALSLDDLFFLFEPRINFDGGQASVTVFYHPAWYYQQNYSNPTTGESEEGAMDADFKLRFGKISENSMQGGLDTLFAFRPNSTDTADEPPLAIDCSPFYSVVSGGVQWDFKLDLRLFPVPNPWYGMFMPYVGLKTSF